MATSLPVDVPSDGSLACVEKWYEGIASYERRFNSTETEVRELASI